MPCVIKQNPTLNKYVACKSNFNNKTEHIPNTVSHTVDLVNILLTIKL